MKLSSTQKHGREAENAIANFLRKNGHTIIAQNYTIHGLGELDLVTKKDGKYHIIEVKSARINVPHETDLKEVIKNAYNPAENFTREKYLRIYRTAKAFFTERNLSHENFQIDLYIVYHDTKNGKFYVKRIEKLIFDL